MIFYILTLFSTYIKKTPEISLTSFKFANVIYFSSVFSCGKIKFKTIPAIAQSAVPDKVIGPTSSTAEPSPSTNIELAIMRLRTCLKSTCFSINTFNPFEAITPYKRIAIPPSTALGIVRMSAVNLPKKLNPIAISAALRMTDTDAIRVNPTTPVFSPYVVLAGPPRKADTAVATPSPMSVRCKPGSFKN